MAKKNSNNNTDALKNLELLFEREKTLKNLKANTPKEIADHWHTYTKSLVIKHMEKLPVEHLSHIYKALPINAIKEAGFNNLSELYPLNDYQLEKLPGIGASSSFKIVQGTNTIFKLTTEEMHPRLDPDNLTPEALEVIRYIDFSEVIGKSLNDYTNTLNTIRPTLRENLAIVKRKKGRLKWFFTSKKEKQTIEEAELYLSELLDTEPLKILDHLFENSVINQKTDIELKNSFIENSVSYYTKLEKLTGYGKKSDQSLISSDLVSAIEAYELTLDNFSADLRGYQEFGAKYMLHQKKTLLGDEMGLGKTIQALAAINHLYRSGKVRTIVISPLSVITNWERETKKFTSIPANVFHGKLREKAFEEWEKTGGILITTFEHAKLIPLEKDTTFDMCVVDEAHYVKNPEANRSKAVYNVADISEYVIFMSGTPLENRVEEMKQLMSVLQPEIAEQIKSSMHSLQPKQFRQTISPVYLRRNREEVLAELPKMEVLERWVDFGKEESDLYKEYVEQGNLMGMRRSAWTGKSALESPKLETLIDICKEAKVNGYKVLVFSFFRDVIRTIRRNLKEDAFEAITGDVSNARRQEIIDEFTLSDAGSILVSQITAGGVGLNIQAANVVIICEPQWKPSIEQQAVSRAYRMGQTRDVIIYRLLTKNSIDESMIELLGFKSQIFDDYARESDIADQSISAKDATDKGIRQKLISVERERLII